LKNLKVMLSCLGCWDGLPKDSLRMDMWPKRTGDILGQFS